MALTPFLRWDTDVYYTEEDEPHVIGKCYEDHGGLCTYDQMNAFDNTSSTCPPRSATSTRQTSVLT